MLIRVGYVFRGRYKSEGIYDEKHLYNCIKNIYDNPVKAGICIEPQEYPYSKFKNSIRIIEDKYYTFIDVEIEKDDEQNINDFLKQNNITLMDIKENKDILQASVKTLKNEYNISLRKIAEVLNIGRETIRKIYKE